MGLRLDDPDPRIRDLAYLLFLEEALGPQWVERWARSRGKLDALREWRKVARLPPSESLTTQNEEGVSALDLAPICSQICSHRLREPMWKTL